MQERRVGVGRRITDVGRWGRRLPVQVLAVLGFNGYYWAPAGKFLCLPVLNCYACPIGTVACPIGTLSAFALVKRFPYYVVGLLGMMGLAVGRAFCGWACPFGLMQDALYRIRSPKWKLPRAADWLKYLLLVGLVLTIPLLTVDTSMKGAADRITGERAGVIDYCSTICPAGTMEGSLPALAISSDLRAQASWRTWSKVGIMLGIVGLMVVSRRGFCRALCPLGALMALSSRVALLQLRTHPEKCTRCMRCVKVCPTACRSVPSTPEEREATAECVLCLDCVRNCPEPGALAARFGSRDIVVSKARNNEQ